MNKMCTVKKKTKLKNPAGMNLDNTMLRTRSQTPKEHILRDSCEVQNQVRLTYNDQKKKKKIVMTLQGVGKEKGRWGPCNILFLRLGAGSVGVFTVLTFIKLNTYDGCTFFWLRAHSKAYLENKFLKQGHLSE